MRSKIGFDYCAGPIKTADDAEGVHLLDLIVGQFFFAGG